MEYVNKLNASHDEVISVNNQPSAQTERKSVPTRAWITPAHSLGRIV